MDDNVLYTPGELRFVRIQTVTGIVQRQLHQAYLSDRRHEQQWKPGRVPKWENLA
jgi:hypothetical protein